MILQMLRVRATGFAGGKDGPKGQDLRIEVVDRAGNVLGVLPATRVVITCDGRKGRVTAALEVNVDDVDVVAVEG